MYRARYRRIVLFYARYLLSLAVWDLLLPRLGLRRIATRTRPARLRKMAAAFRRLAISMGGVLIKVGQFLSTRVDVLPPEFTDELTGLQDEVPAEDFDRIRRVAESELGGALEQYYLAIDPMPLAAASLGQVHLAQLEQRGDGPSSSSHAHSVVVKIQRPNIEQLIQTDLAALHTVGTWLKRYPPIHKRVDVAGLLAEFTRILYGEIDYLAEGRNAENFGGNFHEVSGVRVPKVYWSHTTRRTLTLENVLAIKITDYTAIETAGISRADVAGRLLDTYLKQIFEDGFFHADPHPGNLFVHPLSGGAWELTFVDFGMVGHLPENLRLGLREMVIGVGMRDSHRVVQAYQMMDLLLPGADLMLIEQAGTRVFERFWGKNMTELTSVSFQEMKDLADEFRELIYSLPFQVPQNVIFLGRCVAILSGMCTGLDPHFNVWEHLAPYARKLIAQEALRSRENWFAELERLGRSFLSVPPKVDTILTRLERGEVAVRAPEVDRQVQKLEHAMRQVSRSVVFTGLLLAAVQLYSIGEIAFAGVLLAAAALSMIGLLINGRRSR